MHRIEALLALVVLSLSLRAAEPQPADDASSWTMYVTNDNCPDYTWGYTEEQTRQAFADIVRAHLDEMTRTDAEPPCNRDRYNMAVTQEALCFVERYPDRKNELVRRIREGRIFVSPYLCNSLWAFQSVESAIRTFYPARRLEKEWGIPMDVAEHIEEPSLPWGTASILAGCGVRWLSSPFYNYDSTFRSLQTPPLFVFEGPDGGQVRVVMDPFACNRASYAQGAQLLRDPKKIMGEWLPHYRQLGAAYPVRAMLASGTHGDISPRSGSQARGFADSIIRYNASPEPHPRLVNATLPEFCRAVDEAQAKSPFLPTVRGCFGHSWDVWPVSLAKYVADTREGERQFLAAETLLAVASLRQPQLRESTRADRERAEWCWSMLSDHAWNGTNDANKRLNADLRRRWATQLLARARTLAEQAWAALGLERTNRDLVLFNSLSFPRRELVRVEVPAGVGAVADGATTLSSQLVDEGSRRALYFVSPEVPAFGFKPLQLKPAPAHPPAAGKLEASLDGLESPFYRLELDYGNGGLSSLVHKPTGAQLLAGKTGRGLCQTLDAAGANFVLTDAAILAAGPVLARLKIEGTLGEARVTHLFTVYAELDRVDFDVLLVREGAKGKERFCQVFPVLRPGATLRLETPGAVIRPRPQPDGDLLPGADTKRFAVQGFVDVSSPDGPGVTIAPLDSYVLRNDLEPLTFEALGNDQNFREVTQDQDGVMAFRFRYMLRAHAAGYDNAGAFAWSRGVATPLQAAFGKLTAEPPAPPVRLDPARALALCLKPSDGASTPGLVLRLWETAGQTGSLAVAVPGVRRAVRTDLLERDLQRLPLDGDQASVDLRGYGFAGVRLEW